MKAYYSVTAPLVQTHLCKPVYPISIHICVYKKREKWLVAIHENDKNGFFCAPEK